MKKTKPMTKEEIQRRRKNQLRFAESARLEGIEYTDKQNAMFDMFEQKGWTPEQCIEYIVKLYGHDKE